MGDAMSMRRLAVLLLLAPLTFLATGGCSENGRQVVVYTSLDPVFSETILARFEERTGIDVRIVPDTEATKTTGLVERVRREKDNPRCDVLWNNEVLRTIRMAREGLFAPYRSPSAEAIPDRFRDARDLWTGFAARARVIAFDPAIVTRADVPKSHEELLDPRWRGKIVIADPRFGTTGSHLAFLFATIGEEKGREFLTALRANGAEVVGGNSTSRDRVVAGLADLGLTDTDDVEVVRRRGVSIDDVFVEEQAVIPLVQLSHELLGKPRGIDFVAIESRREDV